MNRSWYNDTQSQKFPIFSLNLTIVLFIRIYTYFLRSRYIVETREWRNSLHWRTGREKREKEILSDIQTGTRKGSHFVAIERATIFARRVYTLARWIASLFFFYILYEIEQLLLARWKVSMQASNSPESFIIFS